jgi:hypothetical protein
VAERLKGRGVDVTGVNWDAWRAEDGPWTVVLTFPAGERQRQASWSFDLADRTVSAVDDEARWLSEDVQTAKGPIPAPHLSSAPVRATKVYDVEAEGGLQTTAQDEPHDKPLDLMTAMRERSTAGSRRKSGGRRGSRKAPTNVPGAGDHAPEQALPLADLAYDPETMAPPPGAHADPDSCGVDARPEPAAAAYLIGHSRDIEHAHVIARAQDVAPGGSSVREPDVAPAAEATAHPVEPGGPAAGPPPRKAGRKTDRPSVPAWDDIIFGSKPGID